MSDKPDAMRADFEKWWILQEHKHPVNRVSFIKIASWNAWQAVYASRDEADCKALVGKIQGCIAHIESFDPHKTLNADALGQIHAFEGCISITKKHFNNKEGK